MNCDLTVWFRETQTQSQSNGLVHDGSVRSKPDNLESSDRFPIWQVSTWYGISLTSVNTTKPEVVLTDPTAETYKLWRSRTYIPAVGNRLGVSRPAVIISGCRVDPKTDLWTPLPSTWLLQGEEAPLELELYIGRNGYKIF